MKKLMVAFVAVAMAMVASAGTVTWKTAKTGGAIFGPETSVALASGTAYLFLADQAQTVFNDWVSGTALSAMNSLDDNTIAAGKITAKSEGITVASGNFSAIVATVTTIGDKEYLFISNPASAQIPDVGADVVSFAATADSKLPVMDAGAGYQGAGWYAVPEPTSGLLLLLGMAGLALKRKQA